jgi:hypothetical protein
VLVIGQASGGSFIVTIPFALSRIGMTWSLLAGMGRWGVKIVQQSDGLSEQMKKGLVI